LEKNFGVGDVIQQAGEGEMDKKDEEGQLRATDKSILAETDRDSSSSSLLYRLPPKKGSTETLVNGNLVRLVLTSGFYPDVAMARGKRNTLHLRRIPSVSFVPGSVNYTLGRGVIEAALPNGYADRHRLDIASRALQPHSSQRSPESANFFIYEELIDVGQKFLSKTTAVDPIFFLLFAHNLKFRYYSPAVDSGKNSLLARSAAPATTGQAPNALVSSSITVDGWIQFRGTKEADLRLLTELGSHWNDFIQFVIHKKLRKVPFTSQEVDAIRQFRAAIETLAADCNLARPIASNSYGECDRRGNPIARSPSTRFSPSTSLENFEDSFGAEGEEETEISVRSRRR
jgi:hypothetical protein